MDSIPLIMPSPHLSFEEQGDITFRFALGLFRGQLAQKYFSGCVNNTKTLQRRNGGDAPIDYGIDFFIHFKVGYLQYTLAQRC